MTLKNMFNPSQMWLFKTGKPKIVVHKPTSELNIGKTMSNKSKHPQWLTRTAETHHGSWEGPVLKRLVKMGFLQQHRLSSWPDPQVSMGANACYQAMPEWLGWFGATRLLGLQET